MKTCLIIGGALSKLGGLEKHFIELAKGLMEYYEVSVVAHGDYRKCFQDAGTVSMREGFSYVFDGALCLKKPLLSADIADVKLLISEDLLIETVDVDLIREKVMFYLANKDKIDFSKYYDTARENLSENMILKTFQAYQETPR